MAIPENIVVLGQRESELREQSLGAIDGDERMSDHLDVIEATMSALMDHVRDRPERSQAELVVKRLGIRLFNNLASGLSQGLKGYYQQAFDAVRDVVELQFLFDDFGTDPEKPLRWALASKVEREREFRPAEVRKRLDARYKHVGDARRKAYQALSTMASHPSPDGFALITPRDNLSVTGPFFEARFLDALLAEMAQHGLGAGVNFTSLLAAQTEAEMAAKIVYAQRAGRWVERYMSKEVAEVMAADLGPS
jgi:hypothetical protein